MERPCAGAFWLTSDFSRFIIYPLVKSVLRQNIFSYTLVSIIRVHLEISESEENMYFMLNVFFCRTFSCYRVILIKYQTRLL